MVDLVTQRHRARLSEAISGQRNAGTRGVRKVIQRSDGAILSGGTMWWTYDIGEALEANERTWCPSGARLVPVVTARSYIVRLMEVDFESLSGKFQGQQADCGQTRSTSHLNCDVEYPFSFTF